jgi:DNA polymerase I-like protein with 3'-5' exonuclease and polymerase domains
MKQAIFDIETNGLLKDLTTIHCIAIQDGKQSDRRVKSLKSYRPDQIEEALEVLENAEEIIGHNIIGFDIPAIQKLYPQWKPKGKVIDTLVLSRLIKADLMSDDATCAVHPDGFTRSLWGSHSLKAWGLRMGNLKGDYDGGWTTFNEDMLLYMEQDVNVTFDLYRLLSQDKDFSQRSIDLEHELAEICFRIGNNGWTFDEHKAGELYAKLCGRRLELQDQLDTLFEPWEIRTPFTPKVNNKARGYVKGETIDKVKVIYFNPNSRKHIARCLTAKYNWKPQSYTPSGDPKIDENVLIDLPYPEAKSLAEFFLVQKRIAMLAEGNAAWMKLTDADGKIRHNLVSLGTVSGRCACRTPNLQQVPSTRAVYGKECRDLFTVPKGWSLLGSDLSGIELRCLAHLLDDGGEYAKQIMDSDIHTHNMIAAGISNEDGNGRSKSKEFIYSLIFGGGDGLIGKIVGGGAKDGKRLKADFDNNVPAFKSLRNELASAYKRKGFIKGIDGRKLFIRSDHRCLSQILQNAGAVIAKQWVKLIDKEITKQGIEAYIVGFIHDEVQIACKSKEVADYVGHHITGRMAQKAGEDFNFRIPIESEFNVGATWSDTH